MLSRVLEPELMDTPEEALDYDSMDHSAVNRSFVTDFLFAALESGVELESVGSEQGVSLSPLSTRHSPLLLLDLGTGTAQIPIELCRRTPGVQVTAVDLAGEMLRVARQNVERAGFGSRIKLDLADAKRLPYPDGHFAGLISNSIVHHIPEPRRALTDAVRVVRAGGLIFVRDLLRPADDPTVRHLVETYAGDANEHQRAMFEASLRAALSLEEIGQIIAELGFDRATVRATTDRHWTWTTRR